MKPLSGIKKVLKEHKEELVEKYHIKDIGIFGSSVRGITTRKSDMDILVEFSKPIGLFTFLELEDYLEKLLGAKVDLVSKKALKPCIGKHILREVSYV